MSLLSRISKGKANFFSKDVYRAKGEPHPLMKEHGVDAIPFQHPDLNIWRKNFKGIQYHHKPTDLLISGAVDDVWISPPPCHPEHSEGSQKGFFLNAQLLEASLVDPMM